ncbi:MAG: magnesium transporter [Micrococcales bacterium]|nr:MAG: magnesium transporter [Micrococcales bacterium]
MSASARVFVSTLAGAGVFDPQGDRVGKVRDVVLLIATARIRPRAVGLVVEVPGRRQVFLQLSRVTSVEAGQVIMTGVLNMRRFQQRSTESLALAEVLDRTVTLLDGSGTGIVEDLGLVQQRSKEWEVARVSVRRGANHRGFSDRLRRRRGEVVVVDYRDVTGLFTVDESQPAVMLAAQLEDMKPADIAEMLHSMPPNRRLALAGELDDARLADVLEELPDEDKVLILRGLDRDRAADVLEEMEPDDAADLLGELSTDQQEHFLEAMEPEEAEDLRRLLTYEERTAGGMMTSDPIVLPPEATIAEALAIVRQQELSPFLAAAVFVCRPPLETPTGRYLGLVHTQRLLREPPHEPVGNFIDTDIAALGGEASLQTVTRRLATYNLISLPVTDTEGRLIGAVTADDVLDHLLPEDWRTIDDAEHDARTAEMP